MKVINKMDDLLRMNPEKSLRQFCYFCENLFDNLDAAFIYQTAKKAIAYYNADKMQREFLRPKQLLEKQWYDGLDLKESKIDYSVYDSDEYIGDLWACWQIYSRKYLKDIMKPNSLNGKSIFDDLGDIKTVVDLGCGFGYTTIALKQLFLNAEILGTNLEDTKQMKICRKLANIYNFRMINESDQIQYKVDLIFASEYFEHFLNPIDHLDEILSKYKPHHLLIANAFTAESIGHFPEYHFKGNKYTGKQISSKFNGFLREKSYKKINTKLWNNRPNYWKIDALAN